MSDEVTAPLLFGDLTHRQRRRLMARSLLRLTVTTLVLFAVYYAMPVEDVTVGTALLTLIGGLAVFVGVIAWQVRRIVNAPYPQLRAFEAVGAALPLLVVVFALVYVATSVTVSGSFSEPLTKSSSLYFTITVLSTVGFGDIVPRSDPARLVTSVQMLLDLVLIGAIARLLVGAARFGLQRQHDATTTGDSDGAGGAAAAGAAAPPLPPLLDD